jgi:hypothetical protein
MAHRWTSREVTDQVKRLIIAIDPGWGFGQVLVSTTFDNLGWDDGAKRRLANDADKAFGVTTSRGMMVAAKTVEQVCDHIKDRLRAGGRLS